MVLNVIRPRRKLGWMSFVIMGSLLLAVVLVTTPAAKAEVWWPMIAGAISSFCLMIATLFLKLTIFVLTFIIQIAAYNGYLDSTAVNYGWVMVRDVTNMCFVVILLLIAFGTILGLEQYEWKKMMVKFVLAAILVNFSRVICGVIIDVGQVVMVTFINGVAATAGGNLITMFNADKIMSLTGDGKSINDSEILMAAVAAVGFSAMMLGTMFVFLIMLMGRMLTLWVLIVLSPLAFVLSVIPQTQKYASEWWQNFGNNVISGPVIAFFLWLSFVTVGGGNINNEISGASQTDVKITDTNEADKIGQESAGISSAMSWSKMANFAIAIGMLLVGAKTAQQLGVAGGSMMSKVTDFAKKATALATGAAAGKWLYGKKGAIGKAVGMNIPLVGGKAWQLRGLAVKDKLLQGATKWNQKMGSRLGSWAQFGAYEKLTKERQAVIETRKGELSSSVKGFEGLGITDAKTGSILGKKVGGVEKYRAYVDEIAGKQMVTKEGSEAYRTARKTAAQRKVLEENKAARERYAARTMASKTEAAKLETAKTKIELDVLTGILAPSAPIAGAQVLPDMAGEYTGSLADRDISQNALMNRRSEMVTEESTARDTEALHIEESAANIQKLEDSIKDLEAVLGRVSDPKSNPNEIYGKLPKDIQDRVGDVSGIKDDDEMREKVAEAIKASLDTKKEELKGATLDYGKIQIGSKGEFAKQIQLLEAIQKALVKEKQKPGSGELPKVLAGFEDGVVSSVGLQKNQQFDANFTGRKLSRDLEGALAALKNMQKQKAENTKKEEEAKKAGKTYEGKVSLVDAGRSTRRVEIIAKQTRELSGTVDLNVISSSPTRSDVLAEVLKMGKLDAAAVSSGLSEEKIKDVLREIKRNTDSTPKLKELGVSEAAVEGLLRRLASNSGDAAAKTTISNILK